MLRRNPLQKFYPLLAAAAMLSAVPQGAQCTATGGVAAEEAAAPIGHGLVLSARHVTLVYDSSLLGSQLIARAEADAAALGVNLVKTHAAAHSIIVEGTEESLRRALLAAEGQLPIVDVVPTYLAGNDPHPLSMVTFTGRMAIRFAPDVRESQKQRLYRQHGLELLYENTAGYVMLRSGRRADLELVGLGEQLAAAEGVQTAFPEVAFTGEPTAAAATPTQIADRYFNLQWPLFNAGSNTNFAFGRADADMDTPRAWQIAARNGNPRFGDSSITVAVFDSGTELTHPDLAASLDPRLGRDFQEGGQPTPTRNTLGAHGTAMASLVAGAANNEGIIGVAPGVRIYTSRIFGPDYSTTNAILVSALSDSVSAGIDINLHPYVLPVACSSTLIVNQVEDAFRLSFQSGRSGVGTLNVAAAGNFFSQVEYPASGRYVLAIGAHSAENNLIQQSNWGGVGIDLSMPSYRILVGPFNDTTYGTGVITADLTGPEGFAGTAFNVAGNSNRQWGALGVVSGFNGSTASVASQYLGTSVAAAFAAGSAALLISDDRYTCLPPHIDYGNAASRASRRARSLPDVQGGKQVVVGEDEKGLTDPLFCPPRERGTNLYQIMSGHNDLPSPRLSSAKDQRTSVCGPSFGDPGLDMRGQFEYVGGYNEQMGFGRFNVANALNPVPVPTDDTISPGFLEAATLVRYTFGLEGPAGSSLPSTDPEAEDPRPGLTGGWAARGDDDANGIQTLDEEGNPIESSNLWLVQPALGQPRAIVSPFLEAVTSLQIEDGNSVRTIFAESGSNRLYVWTDSAPVFEGAELQTANNLVFNPDGAYLRQRAIELIGPKHSVGSLPGFRSGVPGVVEIQIGYELGIEDSSTSTNISQEIDPLRLNVTYFRDLGDGPVPETINIAEFIGDTLGGPKARLCPAERVEINQAPIVGDFPRWNNGSVYRPRVGTSDMPIRTFRFTMPPIPADVTDIQFSLRLDLNNSNNSWLPTYRPTQNGPEQMFNVFRDHGGFVFYGMSVKLMREFPVNFIREPNHLLVARGYQPVFSSSGNDILFLNRTGGESMGASKPRFLYASGDRTSPNVTDTFRPMDILALPSRATGLKANPVSDIVAITTADGGVYTATSDGANLRLVDTIPGARDPFWASNGSQLLVATPKTIEILNFTSTGSVIRESSYNDANGVATDIRTPVFSSDAGIIYFTGVLKSDTSANPVRRIYVSTRGGRIIPLSGEEHQGLLVGWGNVSQYDIDISQSGRRLVFVANADVPPTIAPDGIVEEEAQPSAPNTNRIFTIENIRWVTESRNIPIYTTVPFSASRNEFQLTAARYPRLSLNDGFANPRITYTGYRSSDDITVNNLDSRIAVQRLPQENNSCAIAPPPPTPAPTIVGPTPTAPPIDTALVIQIGESSFDITPEGWQFGSAAPVYAAPTGQHRVANPTANPAVEGALTLRTNGNTNTFGFWSSPAPAFASQVNSIYLVRSRVRALNAASDSVVPTLRIRANSMTSEHAALAVTNSLGDLSISPSLNQSRTHDLIFAPPVESIPTTISQRGYFMGFDLVNVGTSDDPNGGLALEQIDVYRLDDAQRHVALYCVRVPSSNLFLTLTATGSSRRSTPLVLELRGCCNNPNLAVNCAVGTSGSGATLTFGALAAGTYTVVVTSSVDETISLSWDASAALPSDCSACVTSTKEVNYESIADACAASTTISGISGTATAATFYDGAGIMPVPQCDPIQTNTVVKRSELIFSSNLALPADRSLWTSGGAPANFPLPVFGQSDRGLTMRFTDNSRVGFGFWTLDGTKVPLTGLGAAEPGPWIYKATFLISSEETDPTRVPVIRVRLQTDDGQRIAEAIVDPGQAGRAVPIQGRPIVLEAYLPLEALPTTFGNFVVGFDLINANAPRPVTTKDVVLESFKVERVYIPNYPAQR